MNRMIEALGALCRREPAAEKWLMAPSLRVGFQWLDAVCRAGQPVLNVRVKTLRHAALELAGPEMQRRNLSFLAGARAEALIEHVFATLRQDGLDYLSAFAPHVGLTPALLSAVRDLRGAGLTAADLAANAFEVEAKGRELQRLLEAYERALAERALTDYAGALRMALDRLKAHRESLPGGARFLAPSDAVEELQGLEREFWNALPEDDRIVLPVDAPCAAVNPLSDLALLRWIERPADAPPPPRDGSVRIFRAVGEINEVREVFRTCVAEGIPFDAVEVVVSDPAAYTPLFFETSARYFQEGADTLPITFADGVPAACSRPGRALAAWAEWVREGFPQSALVRMIREGLLAAEGASCAEMAAAYRSVPVVAGRERSLAALDAHLKRIAAHPVPPRDAEDDAPLPARRNPARALEALRPCVADLVGCTPDADAPEDAVLAAAAAFLDRLARCASRLDYYSRKKLVEEMAARRACLKEFGARPAGDAWGWVAALAGKTRIGGQGPRPGRLYVSNLRQGGHSGRPHTFILGLDDARFPGAGLQDPLLLDAERGRLSSELATAAGRQARAVADFARLLARLRGRAALSYCCRSLDDDRDLHPCNALLAAWRAVSGRRDGDLAAMLRDLDAPVSFAPSRDAACADAGEAWLRRLCAGGARGDRRLLLAPHFPHLARGLAAAEARASARFTAWDGHVPEAGVRLNPFAPDGPVLSAGRLETLARCPMDYFFRYVLGIEPPEEYALDPAVWLDRLQKGALLHEVFCEFLSGLTSRGLLPDFDRDQESLRTMVERRLEAHRRDLPPLNEDVYDRERAELLQTADIFLREEEDFCRTSRPRWFEVAIGMASEGARSPLDCAEPALITLPGGRRFRARGRVDRVDEVGTGRFAVWDYKTGRPWKDDPKDPFDKGRRVQGVFYIAMSDGRLKEAAGPEARVESFGYFFPGHEAHGERLQWRAEELTKGMETVARLCEMLARGCFPLSPDAREMAWSDYKAACGNLERACAQSKAKLADPANDALTPFRELRGIAAEESDGGE